MKKNVERVPGANKPPIRNKRMNKILAKAAIVTVLAALGSGEAASASEASIVPGKSVGGVALNASTAKAKQMLGMPVASRQEGKESIWSYGKPFLGSLSFVHNKVDGIMTLSKSEKTDTGVGPGTSYEKTTAAYPDAQCAEGTFGPNSKTCVLDSEYKGRATETDFVFYDITDATLGMREVDISFK